MGASWRPIHENHAIDVMAAVLTFSEPVPALLFRKALKASEDAAFDAGLRSRHFVQGLEFTMGPAGLSAGPSQGANVRGQMFNSLADAENAVASSQLGEQLHVHQNQLVYRTWQYVSWSWQSERLRTLFSPALQVLAGSISIQSQRLEYLDRFRSDGNPPGSELESIIRKDSQFIAPHVFLEEDLWHSHTGAFLPSIDTTKRLQQVHLDLLPDPPTGARWLNIMTAREDRFDDLSLDAVETNADVMLEAYNVMHSELKTLLAAIITDSMARRIYLKD